MLAHDCSTYADVMNRSSHPTNGSKTRGHKDGKLNTAKQTHQIFLNAAIRPVELIRKPHMAEPNRPVGASEMMGDHTTKAAHHQRETLRRAQESDKIDTVEDLSDYSPPPSPPRPIHQGGGQYAPGQLRNRLLVFKALVSFDSQSARRRFFLRLK
ncbi:uncharacterized protein LY79DRAFT_536604 [Colletotrichum navitas]|uniref:Uncharacterized protein n=1 Tax=Colletotrichum navitas TaxID=681940 RepID=A0AAD8QCV9_9PEZI|nr:uncharacterized protein LY79DRAFT_536604 [Colletotrichum navitas]KAK1599008.1 hypothetical protein LY79DRAFT_536604 [Colletotrichum navitas]